jgi:hypothetical protein
MVRSPAPDVRPGFVIGAGSCRPSLMAEMRVDEEYQSPEKSGFRLFAPRRKSPTSQITS